MKFEDFQVNTYNKGNTMRVTHLGTGVNRLSDDVTQEKVLQLMNDIRDEVDAIGRPCSFAKALEAVVEQGKGMQIVGDDSVVRAQFPDQYSMSDLPYLYITSKYGRVPWSIDSFSPFATWVVVD